MRVNRTKKTINLLLVAILILLLSACGSSSVESSHDDSKYEGATENYKPFFEWEYPSTFKKDRDKVFEYFEKLDTAVLETEITDRITLPNADENTVMVKSKIGLKHEFIEYIVSDSSSDDDVYIYYGEHKDGVPNGTGILFDPYRECPVFAGTFKNGKVKGYGMIFNSITSEIAYESEDCEYNGDEEFLANGKSIKYDRAVINDILYEVRINAIAEAEFDSNVPPAIFSLAPSVIYEGKMKSSEAKGEGKSYFSLYSDSTSADESSQNSGLIYGALQYDGEWKDDSYHGKGKLYNQDGSLNYEGKFSFGKIKN